MKKIILATFFLTLMIKSQEITYNRCQIETNSKRSFESLKEFFTPNIIKTIKIKKEYYAILLKLNNFTKPQFDMIILSAWNSKYKDRKSGKSIVTRFSYFLFNNN